MTVKEMCKTGVFGVTSDGDVFVVVDNTIVYQNGAYDTKMSMSDDGDYNGYRVNVLVTNCKSFDGITRVNKADVIFDRSKRVEMTLEEVRKKLNLPHLIIKD